MFHLALTHIGAHLKMWFMLYTLKARQMSKRRKGNAVDSLPYKEAKKWLAETKKPNYRNQDRKLGRASSF